MTMKETTLARLRELAARPVPAPKAPLRAEASLRAEDDQLQAFAEGEAHRLYVERRTALGKLALGDEDNSDLMMLLEVLGNRDDDPDHPLAGNIETLNAMVAQLARSEEG
jgi:hypothetical protein